MKYEIRVVIDAPTDENALAVSNQVKEFLSSTLEGEQLETSQMAVVKYEEPEVAGE